MVYVSQKELWSASNSVHMLGQHVIGNSARFGKGPSERLDILFYHCCVSRHRRARIGLGAISCGCTGTSPFKPYVMS